MLKKFNEFISEELAYLAEENIESITYILYKYGITNYTIYEDGSIDANSGVDLSYRGLTKLPLKFRKVTGFFNCSNNELTSLEGCPITVSGNFDCSDNQLTTLEGAPQSVGKDFNCSNNELTSLEGCPIVVGNFNCSYNKLTSLEGAPKSVGGYFFCNYNRLETLEGAPKSVGGAFYCNNNKLVSLEGAPKYYKLFYCTHNPIYKWWYKVDDINKLDSFIDLGIDCRDPDFMNEEKIDLLKM